jgi:hypothetical protein
MTQETLTGVLSKIVWASPEDGNDYKIAKLSTGQTVLGNAPENEFIIGQTYTLQGSWKLGKEFRGVKERQFHFTKFERHEAHTRIGLVHYLEKFCPGIGPTLAGRIFDKYQQEAVSKLRTFPAEVSETVPGISLEVAQAASEELKKNVKFEEARIELNQLFAGKGFSRQLINMVLKKWGVQAASRIRRDPFCLLVEGFPSAGFARCDRLYVEQGKKLYRLKRLMLFIWHQVRESLEGHTWHDAKEIIAKLRRDASVSDEGTDSMKSADKRILRAIELGVRSGWLAIKKTDKGIFVSEGQSAENEDVISKVVLGIVNGRKEESPEDELILMTERKRVEGEAEQDEEEFQKASKAANRGDYEDEIPVDVLIKIGIESGICQFCGRMLTHPESKVRGYGPQCGSKRGLPWSAGSGEAYSNDGVSQSLLAEVGAE